MCMYVKPKRRVAADLMDGLPECWLRRKLAAGALGVKVADEDIICWKVLDVDDGKLVSPYQYAEYEKGVETESDRRLEYGCILGCGYVKVYHGIHMFVNRMDTLMYGKRRVHRCVIPAGTRYVMGYGFSGEENIVAEKVIVE